MKILGNLVKREPGIHEGSEFFYIGHDRRVHSCISGNEATLDSHAVIVHQEFEVCAWLCFELGLVFDLGVFF